MTDIPGAFSFIQQESIQFNNPTSESSLTAIGATINGLLSIVLPVGSVLDSMLTETQFQTQIGNLSAPFLWVLADGRSVAGSTYESVTGNSTVPDLRSVLTRGKDNGRGLNPDGDLALGTYTADKFASHTHATTDPGHTHTITDPSHSHALYYDGLGLPAYLRNNAYQGGTNITATDATGSNQLVAAAATTGITGANSSTTGISQPASTGGNETAPKTVTLNKFIRIN